MADRRIPSVVYVKADQYVMAPSGGDQLSTRVYYTCCRHDEVARPERYERLSLERALRDQAWTAKLAIPFDERKMQWIDYPYSL